MIGRPRKLVSAFIEEAIEIHQHKYDYTNVVWTTSMVKVPIFCKEHGIFFLMTPNCHLKGRGCPTCAKEQSCGFSKRKFIEKYKNKICILYIVKLTTEKEDFLKIGITGRSVEKRRVGDGVYENNIITIIEDTAENVWNLEKYLHRNLKEYKYIPETHFPGETECFTLSSLKELSELLQKQLN